MVSERKTIQPEASGTFRHMYNFVVMTTRDFVRCPRCGFGIYPDSVSGRFDNLIAFPVGYGLMYWGAIEVKNGTSTNLPFDSVSDKQIMWYYKKEDLYDHWLWFSIGDRIGGKTHPRRTFLIPFSLFLSLKESLDRKSIPVDCEEIQTYELEWAGNGRWIIPSEHEMWKNIKEFSLNEGEVNEVV